MGGIQTLNIGLHNLGTFRYLAVMSSGWTSEQDSEFFCNRSPEDPQLLPGAEAVLVGWGETDIARTNGLAVMDRFKSQGVPIERRETPGGHTWENWRFYLSEVAPKLFADVWSCDTFGGFVASPRS